MRQSRVVAFPTAVFITLHDGTRERVTLAEGPCARPAPRPDRRRLRAGRTRPSARTSRRARGSTGWREILRRAARFGPLGIVAGTSILTVGLAMVLMPTLTNLAAAALLGAIVGVLKLVNRDRPVLAVPTPVIAATLVVGAASPRACSRACRSIRSTCWCRRW